MLTEQRVEELDLSIIQSIPSIHQKTEKASGNNKALAWILKKLECLFLFPAAAWGHTEKKKDTQEAGVVPYSGRCKCMLLVSWICAVAQANAVQLPIMQ